MTGIEDTVGRLPTASVEDRLAPFLDRAEISELVDRYVVTLDIAEREECDLDWYRGIFTDDVTLSFPIGDRAGVDGLPDFQRAARLSWGVTHHVSANHVIDLDGDRARGRVQLVGTHVERGAAAHGVDQAHRFDMGGYYDIRAVRTPAGWRIDHLRYVVVWTSGGGSPGPRPTHAPSADQERIKASQRGDSRNT